VAIKNGQSRETANVVYTEHRPKANKTKYTTQKPKKDGPNGSLQKSRGGPRCPRKVSSSSFL